MVKDAERYRDTSMYTHVRRERDSGRERERESTTGGTARDAAACVGVRTLWEGERTHARWGRARCHRVRGSENAMRWRERERENACEMGPREMLLGAWERERCERERERMTAYVNE